MACLGIKVCPLASVLRERTPKPEMLRLF